MVYVILKFSDEVHKSMSEEQMSLLNDSFRNAVQMDLHHCKNYNTYHALVAQICKPVLDHKAYISIVYYDDNDVKKGTVYLHSWGVY